MLAVGCVDPDFGGTSFQCNEAEPCPSGQSCVAGRCQSDVGDDASIDSDVGGDAQICVEPIALSEDFDSPGIDFGVYQITAPGSTSVSQNGGELVITTQPGFLNPRFAALFTRSSFDLRDARVFIEVTQVTNTATTAQTRLRIGPDNNSYLYIIEDNGMLRAGSANGGTETDTVSIPYNATDHRFWQIRESAGQAFGEVSTNGEDWTVVSSEGSPAFVDSVLVDLSAGTPESVADPGEAHFDNLNGGGPLAMCP